VTASLRRVWAVAYNTHLESVRQRFFLGQILFAFLLIASALILKDISVGQDAKILKDIGLASTEFFGTLIAIFLGADLINRDIEKRTLHLLLVKPLSRTEFIVGRYLGLCSTILTSILLMCLGITLALATVHASFSWALVKAAYAIALLVCLTGAISTFLSTTTSRPLALLGASILCVLGRMSDVLKNASMVLEGFPDWLGRSLYYVVPNLQNFDLKTRAVYGDAIPDQVLLHISAYAAAYVVGLLALAALLFASRDLK
jgi:ABC-type transport system involved in multi-copper enzyme maturation permease subunit